MPRSFLGLLGLFADGPACHGWLIGMQDASIKQPFGDQGGASRRIEVRRGKSSARLEVGEQRHLPVDLVEVVDAQFDVGFARDGEQMQHRIRRAAGGGDRGDGVLQGFPRDDLLGAQVSFQQIHDHHAAFEGHVVFLLIHGGHAVPSHHRDAEELERNRHGVGRELTAAGAGARAGMVFEILELGIVHGAGCMFPDRFEDVLNGHVMALEPTWHNRASVEHDRRQVQAGKGHHGAGNGLVAA